MNRIPKKQEGAEGLLSFFSFKAFTRKNNLLLLYNDSYANLEDNTPRPISKSTVKNAQLVITLVDLNDGQFKKRRLQNLFGDNYLVRSNYIQKLNDNELLFYANGRTADAKKSIVKSLKLKAE